MLQRAPQSFVRTMAEAARTNEAFPPLTRLLQWHRDAEDPYGRYCRDERLRLSDRIAAA